MTPEALSTMAKDTGSTQSAAIPSCQFIPSTITATMTVEITAP